jgi:hypothetical protein
LFNIEQMPDQDRLVKAFEQPAQGSCPQATLKAKASMQRCPAPPWMPPGYLRSPPEAASFAPHSRQEC